MATINIESFEKDKISILNIMLRLKYILITLSITVGFTIIYLFLINHIFTARSSVPFSILVLDNWAELIFRERASFNWEPFMLISFDTIRLSISFFNVLLGLVLGGIAGLNISLSVYSLTEAPKACRVNPSSGILSIVPSFFSGFLCCAPTFVAALGIGSAAFTLFFIDILPFLIPAAIISSLAVFFYTVRKLNKGLATVNTIP
ncbi:MAG: hypothetical protein ACXAC2_18640 [Candidatus Kariarchaeaceae archaeon]|jgi:hypothetical protein